MLYVAGRNLGLSRPSATLAAAGALLDLLCLVEQRLVLVDATLLLGIAVQLGACFASDHHAPLSRGWAMRVAAEGVGIILAGCTKMTGFATLAVSGVHSLLSLYHGWFGAGGTRKERARRLLLEALARLFFLIAIPALAYLLINVLHIVLLPNTGPGAKFHTRDFRRTLRGDEAAVAAEVAGKAAAQAAAEMGIEVPRTAAHELPSMWARIVEMNREMVKVNAAINKGHQWGSRWWEWPLMGRTILYWTGNERPYISPPETTRARIYALGNPAVWWLAALAPTLFVAWAITQLLGKLTVAHGGGRRSAAGPHLMTKPRRNAGGNGGATAQRLRPLWLTDPRRCSSRA